MLSLDDRRRDTVQEVPSNRQSGLGYHQPLETQMEEEGMPRRLVAPGIGCFHVNQRNEVINLHGIAGALMATRNVQMQTFITEVPLSSDMADKGGMGCLQLTEYQAPS